MTYDPNRVDELEHKLNKPMYVLKMNRASKIPGAEIRAENARLEIHRLIEEYARESR